MKIIFLEKLKRKPLDCPKATFTKREGDGLHLMNTAISSNGDRYANSLAVVDATEVDFAATEAANAPAAEHVEHVEHTETQVGEN
jgi:hypothetical protein